MAGIRIFLNSLESLLNFAAIELTLGGCLKTTLLWITEAIETLFLYLTLRVKAFLCSCKILKVVQGMAVLRGGRRERTVSFMSPSCPCKENSHPKTREAFINNVEFHYKVNNIYFRDAK